MHIFGLKNPLLGVNMIYLLLQTKIDTNILQNNSYKLNFVLKYNFILLILYTDI